MKKSRLRLRVIMRLERSWRFPGMEKKWRDVGSSISQM
jgi:hypothetical protein